MTDSVPPPDDRGTPTPPFAPVEANAPQPVAGAPLPYSANVPGGPVMVPAGWTQLPPPPPPVESPTAYHRLYRTNPRYRWWRPLVAVLLFGVFALTALLALNIIWFVVAMAVGQVTLDDLARPDFADWLVALLSDITNPLSLVMLLGSLAVLLPLVPLALLCAGIRPVGVTSSVAFRLRWRWMLRCAVPALVVTAVSIGLPWIIAPFTGETITPVEVDPALFALLAVIIVLLVPLQATAEEYIFRGLLLQVVGAWVKAWPLAVVIATILFTIGHTQYEIWGMLSVAVMGLGFAIVTLRTGGLEAAIALHVINNVAAFLVLTSGIQGTTQMSSEGSGPLAPLTQLVLTVAYVLWVDRLASKQGIARRRDLALEPVR
ncbi:CPBP family intramembrane glutamic endopeptidase [Salinibacterium sp. ZJ70]|uniref:CPBP family intramembrane glutamic endopeptidase n=1 Tax=Salinibacterium sp. ZJ70 TaxID=2708084 RepID=UPI0014223F59|nr:CPBP family intramembrane glutamic endopeptidase [Salinibacterium sp. ZJ70]